MQNSQFEQLVFKTLPFISILILQTVYKSVYEWQLCKAEGNWVPWLRDNFLTMTQHCGLFYGLFLWFGILKLIYSDITNNKMY